MFGTRTATRGISSPLPSTTLVCCFNLSLSHSLCLPLSPSPTPGLCPRFKKVGRGHVQLQLVALHPCCCGQQTPPHPPAAVPWCTNYHYASPRQLWAGQQGQKPACTHTIIMASKWRTRSWSTVLSAALRSLPSSLSKPSASRTTSFAPCFNDSSRLSALALELATRFLPVDATALIANWRTASLSARITSS